MMTYYDSAKGITICKQRAIEVLKQHDADVFEFFADCGEKDEYLATDVLDWLGY